MTLVKICGLSTEEAVNTAVNTGADFLGFVFYPPSPRNVSPQQAALLIKHVPETVKTVGLFVDPTDKEIRGALDHAKLDMIQLHGNETPIRLQELREKFGLPLIKAIRVGSKSDLEDLESYDPHIEWFIFDAKPENAELPGGTGEVFDWSLLNNLNVNIPWMLSGGLDVENVTEALSILNPKAVDVSSGVESQRGIKDIEKIKTFIETAKNA